MTVLTAVQNASLALGLSSPSTVVGNSSQQQMLALLQMEGRDLLSRGQWRVLRRRNSFTLSTSDTNQGAMNGTVVTAGDYDYILPDTFWNQDLKLLIPGELSAQGEEQDRALGVASPFQQYAIRGGNLYIIPQPGTADTVTFEYISNFYAKAAAGTLKAAFTLDTDLCVLEENLMTLGLIWRWKRANGLDYAQEFQTYEERVQNALSRDAGGQTLSMAGPPRFIGGIVIPIGSWNV